MLSGKSKQSYYRTIHFTFFRMRLRQRWILDLLEVMGQGWDKGKKSVMLFFFSILAHTFDLNVNLPAANKKF